MVKNTPTKKENIFFSGLVEDSTERDYYTKLETNNLLDKKQDKLIAGDNITIDENNKISATGGKVDLSDYYKKEEIDKKLEDKVDIDKFSYAFAINALGTENPNLETNDKTIVSAINEVKTNIGKLNIIKWKNVGTKKDNVTIEYDFKKDILYRIGYSWDVNPISDAIKYLIFKFQNGHTLLDNYSELANNVSILVQLVVNSNKIFINKINSQDGFIYSLEEAQNKDLKNYSEQILPIIPLIPPTPCPCPKWKEVGTKKYNKTIQFNFIKNKIYRIYYNYFATNDKTEYSWIYKEFIYSGNNNTEYLDSFIYTDGSYTWLQVNQNSIFMTTVPYPFTFGQLLKLEELQE